MSAYTTRRLDRDTPRGLTGLGRADRKVNTPTAPPLQKFKGPGKLDEYEDFKQLGEGTFGVVYRGRMKKNNQIVAIKKVLERGTDDGYPLTAFREMNALRELRSQYVIELVEMLSDKVFLELGTEKKIEGLKKERSYYMVFPYMKFDLAGILMNPDVNLSEPDNKSIMLQMLRGIDYIHKQNFIHRDIKTANILIDSEGIVKIADLGLIRNHQGPRVLLDRQGGGRHKLTQVVMTRYYRAPECVFQFQLYGTAVDIWSIGCVFGELYEKKPILKGDSDIGQGYLIFQLVGSPTEEKMPGLHSFPLRNKFDIKSTEPTLRQRFSKYLSTDGLDLLEKFLTLDPNKRITAEQALLHEYFQNDPKPTESIKCDFEECHESDRDRFRQLTRERSNTAGHPNRIKPETNINAFKQTNQSSAADVAVSKQSVPVSLPPVPFGINAPLRQTQTNQTETGISDTVIQSQIKIQSRNGDDRDKPLSSSERYFQYSQSDNNQQYYTRRSNNGFSYNSRPNKDFISNKNGTNSALNYETGLPSGNPNGPGNNAYPTKTPESYLKSRNQDGQSNHGSSYNGGYNQSEAPSRSKKSLNPNDQSRPDSLVNTPESTKFSRYNENASYDNYNRPPKRQTYIPPNKRQKTNADLGSNANSNAQSRSQDDYKNGPAATQNELSY
ncbi:hypothetical protein WICMUC_005915 [Wickerhamomyces mucosus]|uniref:Serine/threonine-protein kinase BUR1 n=1 Tax=Wickerhamomyces mucosus TaxID=1378264 RepID=A0A9P8P1W0_9ASCO|nr:hypothetical protein WICMUC_005915 [Wickerhamomyces mucosus]